MLMVIVLFVMGCGDSPDERLAELANWSLNQQARQNERLAEQTKQIAEASKQLVEADAESRERLIESHAVLQKDIQTARTNIDRQREDLERERRAIAHQRGRDPIVAQASANRRASSSNKHSGIAKVNV